MLRLVIGTVSVLFFAYVSPAQSEVVIETVPVGNPGNDGELSGEGAGAYGPDRICGSVDYEYNIGKYEITAGQYTEFLNAVAGIEDTYDLYYVGMWIYGFPCGIERTGSSPNFSYSVALDWADRPVTFISWGDAARFANWLHNGQPTGAQDLTTTEDGSYFLDGVTSQADIVAVVREEDATWVIPSEDEWYKAAYHYNDGVTENYFDYATSSDSVPVWEACPGGSNSANYYNACFGCGFTIDEPYYRNEVGCYVSSQSPYGTFDQCGNVWEWNEAVVDERYRGSRGGAFPYESENLHAAYRRYSNPTLDQNNQGFRVADVSEHAPVPGDLDDDGDVDLDDFSLFLPAFADGDVDLSDFAVMQRAFTGPQ